MKLKKQLSVFLALCVMFMLIPATVSAALGDNGTFVINSAEDWAEFAAYIADGEYVNEEWKLGADITVNVSVTSADFASGATIGTETHPFSGTFDGQGHTLTVNISDTYFRIIDFNVTAENQGTAPFRYISGATIKNLTVDGSVLAAGDHPAGLVGFNQSGSSKIENCAVMTNVTVDSRVSSHVGGVLGHNKSATITMTNVVYSGIITTSTYNGNTVGGLVGWSDDSTVNITNCIYDGMQTGQRDVYNAILVKNLTSNVNATFSGTFYSEESLTTWHSNIVGGQNVVNDTVSRRVFPGIPDNNIYEYIQGPYNHDFNIPCTIAGIDANYLEYENLNYTVKNYAGQTLTTAYYTFSLTKNGVSFNDIAGAGVYTLTLTGKNGYTGTFTKTITVYDEYEIPYIDGNGTQQTISQYDVVKSNTSNWNERQLTNRGWYVLLGDVTISSQIVVSGDVNLLLCDGATLNAQKGIGVGENESLTIWAQSQGTGHIIAVGDEYCAGIGAYKQLVENSGAITINGGIIDATGGSSGGAGIGSNYYNTSGPITINNAMVTARGSSGSPGIGMATYITITNSTVTAYGGYNAAGIGGFNNGGCNTITINSGMITAYGGEEAAGIGGGRNSSGGTINLRGGDIKAYGGEQFDIGVTYQDALIKLTYTDDSAADMRVTAGSWSSPVKIEKVFYDEDTLEKFVVTDCADNSALAGKTLIPAANYRVVSLYPGYGSGETIEVPVPVGDKYELPECTFTPPSSLRPFVGWLVKIGAGSTYVLQPGVEITVTDDTTAYARYRTEYGSLQTLIDNAANGATITLDKNYVSSSGSDTPFIIPAGKSITIDLAGYRIDRGLSSNPTGENCNIFTVYGTLTVRDTSANHDGCITGGANSSAGGAIRVETGGTFNLESGIITGNKSTNGGAIYNIGTVNISGGSITNNTSENSGGGIFNNDTGTLNLTGGTISNNSAAANYHGGGIHTSGAVNVSGSPVVTANYRGGTVNNIGLYQGAVITVTGTLTSGASLGVNKSSAGTAALSAGVITNGFEGKGSVSAFVSDNSSLVVGLNANGEALLSVPLTLTFNKGNENATGTMASVTVAPNLPYTLPASGFGAPAHKYFGGWSVGGVTKATGEEITVSANTVITAIWADTPYAVIIQPSVYGTILADKNEATIGSTVTLTPSPDTDYVLETLTVTFGGDTVSTVKQSNGTYEFIMPAGSVTVTAAFRTEIGTAGRPFEIHNSNDWDTFAAMINAGQYTSDYYKLADDFNNSTAVTTTVGTASEPFRGHFDGNGKTLTVNINDTSSEGTAPFRYIADATIEDLTVSGSVTGGTHASGLVGFNWSGESIINNVCVYTNVTHPGTNGNRHIGGVLGHNKTSQITMSNVVFGGTLSNNGSYAGGLVGWSDSSTVILTDCLFKGTYSGSGIFHPLACKNGENSVDASVTRVYYTLPANGNLGANNVTNAGTRVYTAPTPDTININIIPADGATCYIPTEVKGLQDCYNNISGAAFTPTFTVVGEDGTVLNAGTDFSVSYSPSPVSALGEYTVTLTGVNGHSGTYTATFTLLGAIPYVDANGTAQTSVTDYAVIEPGMTGISSGWYAAAGNVTVTSRLNVSGNVNIILCDGATLTAAKGICIEEGNSLTIWAQEEGSGTLIATADFEYAAIGGSQRSACGTVTVNGGVINAHGGESGAGIGGSNVGTGGTITINGGTVYAKGGADAAAIGGGGGAACGTVTINGGTVTADGSYWGAGIGGGYGSNGGTITINGGSVTATSKEAAAIGGGYNSTGGTITINGGSVNASTTGCGAGIGMGQYPKYDITPSSVTISGGVVTASSPHGSGIGLGQWPNDITITVTLGNQDPASFVSITANSISGSVTLTSDLTDKTTVFHTGAVSDPSVLNGKTLMSCVRTESTYNNTESGKQLMIHTYHVPSDAVLVVAWYDENGVLLSTDIVNEFNTTITVTGSALSDYAKVFVWENFNSLKPLRECDIIPFE